MSAANLANGFSTWLANPGDQEKGQLIDPDMDIS